jgi:hypothetical protein
VTSKTEVAVPDGPVPATGKLQYPRGTAKPVKEAALRVRFIRRDLTTLTFTWKSLADNVREAYDARDWEALGYQSWREYCVAEFDPAHMPRAPKDVLAQVVSQLTAEGGMSTRAIGDALGIGKSTVARMVPTVPDGTVDRRVTGLDGKNRPARMGTGPEVKSSIRRLDDALAIAKGRTGLKKVPAGIPVKPALKELPEPKYQPLKEMPEPEPVDAGIIKPDTDIIEPEPIEPGTVAAEPEPVKPDAWSSEAIEARARKWVADQLKSKDAISALLNRCVVRLAYLHDLGLATRAAERYYDGPRPAVNPETVKSAIAALGDILAVLDARDDDQ